MVVAILIEQKKLEVLAALEAVMNLDVEQLRLFEKFMRASKGNHDPKILEKIYRGEA